MIKTIIFDNQGVLTDRDEEGTLQTFAKFFKFDQEKIKPHYLKVRDKIDTGEVTTEEFYELMAKHFEGVKDRKEVADFHINLYESREDIYEFARSLKNRYNIALITNFCDRFHEFNKRWKIDELISAENTFVSSELRMRKPDHSLFKHVLKVLGNEPDEVVFIDDSEENVESARRLGIKSIHFRNLNQVKSELEKILETEKVSV